MIPTELPIVIIGAGPIGLAAAAHLIGKGTDLLVLEAGERVGANILTWGHVRVFSPWAFNVDSAAAQLLEGAGWKMPLAGDYPTGDELVRDYLEPLAALPALRSILRLGTRVTGVSRIGRDRLKTAGRDDAPFVVHVVGGDGEDRILAPRGNRLLGDRGLAQPARRRRSARRG
jgi:cation diffusion facilitator CzcD-associated flavoprotein CzcO